MNTELTSLSRFRRELGAFLEDTPAGLTPEALEALTAVSKALEAPNTEVKQSPGQQAMKYAQEGTKGTGVPFSKAVQGIDVPSPGQTD